MTSLSYNFANANNKVFQANQLFSKYGLSITRVQWNDVERGFGSCYGPNISDWTLREKDSKELLPVIRPDNFLDQVAVISSDDLCVMVGNHLTGGNMKPITLTQYLKEFGKYNTDCPTDTNLYCPKRDSKVTVRAQAVPLPVDPNVGIIQFNPTCYSYQTRDKEDPRNFIGVFSHLGSNGQTDGPDVEDVFLQRTLDDNSRENMYFNATSALMEKDSKKDVDTVLGTKKMDIGRNRVIFGQIPIKQKNEYSDDEMGQEKCCIEAAPMNDCHYRGFSEANISYGESAGTNKGLGRTDLERDTDQHITLTVCFYYAVPNGELNSKMAERMVQDIKKVYQDSTWTGSLVIGKEMPVISNTAPIAFKPYNPTFKQPIYEKGTVQTFPN
jgi:hypothetical protein